MKFTIECSSGKEPVEYADAVHDGDDWTIEIDSLEDLLALSAKTGRALIVGSGGGVAIPVIEIYDDHRE